MAISLLSLSGRSVADAINPRGCALWGQCSAACEPWCDGCPHWVAKRMPQTPMKRRRGREAVTLVWNVDEQLYEVPVTGTALVPRG